MSIASRDEGVDIGVGGGSILPTADSIKLLVSVLSENMVSSSVKLHFLDYW